MNEATSQFITELQALMRKYHVRLYEEEKYDGRDAYCGSIWSLASDNRDIDIPISTEIQEWETK